MDAAHLRHPYRCLPLNIANQNGWVLTCPTDVRCYWYGGPNPADLEVKFDGPPDPVVSSHFGSGVLTFSVPYLFRTPPGVNLWVKGPANWIKDGVQPLEGVVETDWASSTFTMNWKVTRVCEWVAFKAGDPIAMLVPIPRGLTEGMVPKLTPLDANPELKAGLHRLGSRPPWVPDGPEGERPGGGETRLAEGLLPGQDAGRGDGAAAPDAAGRQAVRCGSDGRRVERRRPRAGRWPSYRVIVARY